MDYHKFCLLAENLLYSSDFRKLEKEIIAREPNLWRIIGIHNRENYISKFLAWLLNPKQNHSFEDLFLKEFLIHALKSEKGSRCNLNPIELHVLDLKNAEVKIEDSVDGKRFDIVVLLKSEKVKSNEGFLCLIENKIRAQESKKQTHNYFESSFDKYPENEFPNRIYLFLTPNEMLPQSEKFIPISYQEVLKSLKTVEEKHQLTVTEQFFFKQFRDNINTGIAMDKRITDLAREIYEQHSEVIKILYQSSDEINQSQLLTSNNEWYERSRFFNVGENSDSGYKWNDYKQYGFICAGGGKTYRGIMEKIEVNDIIYAYVSKYGYVGYGLVIKKSIPFKEAILNNGKRLSDMKLEGKYGSSDDYDMCDWIALVDWEYTVDKNQAVPMQPISISTSCKIYEHRKEEIEKIKIKLKENSNLNSNSA